MDVRLAPDRLDEGDRGRLAAAAERKRDVLGADAELVRRRRYVGGGQRSSRREDIHGRRADERRHEAVPRRGPDLVGRADLLHDPRVQHRDTVAENERLDLIVRDVDRRRADATVDLLQLGTNRDAHRRVEVRERFVEEHQRRLADECSGERHPLTLAARELVRLACKKLRATHELRPPLGPADPPQRARDVAHGQPEADVLLDLRCGKSA